MPSECYEREKRLSQTSKSINHKGRKGFREDRKGLIYYALTLRALRLKQTFETASSKQLLII